MHKGFPIIGVPTPDKKYAAMLRTLSSFFLLTFLLLQCASHPIDDPFHTLEAPPFWKQGFTYPALIVIGEMKCSTTTLHGMLSQNPYLAKGAKKEICTLRSADKKGFMSEYISNFQESVEVSFSHLLQLPISYEAFDGQKRPSESETLAPWRGFEACPLYLAHPLARRRIVKYFKSYSKLVALVRNPVHRLQSQLNHHYTLHRDDMMSAIIDAHRKLRIPYNGTEDAATSQEWKVYLDFMYRSCKRSFKRDCPDFFTRGLYAQHTQALLDLGWPKEDLKIFVSEEFNADPDPVMRQIEEFAGLPALAQYKMRRLNKSKSHKTVSKRSLEPFAELYAADTFKLFTKVLRRPLPTSWKNDYLQRLYEKSKA